MTEHPLTPSPRIWVLADGRPGNETQVFGAAEALELPYDTKRIRFNRLAQLPALLQPARSWSLDRRQSDALTPPWPDMVIAAGRRAAPVARAIKRASDGHTRLVHLMNPEAHHDDFDLLVLPAHDQPAARTNQLILPAPPHRLTQPLLDGKNAALAPLVSHLPKPLLGVVIGGTSKHGEWSPAEAEKLAGQLDQIAARQNGSLIVTTSRRTGKDCTAALRRAITGPCYFYDWEEHRGNDDPYPGLLALCDALVLTGDSVSMLAEACFTGKPVLIADEGAHIAAKHRRLHQSLYKHGHARKLTETPDLSSCAKLDVSALLKPRLQTLLFRA